jgi:hypothetical protein
MLIKTGDTSYDASLNIAMEEASRLVDIFFKPYVTIPLSSPDSNVQNITADFAASIFKRRLVPSEMSIKPSMQPDMISDIDGTGWFALGLRKIEQYIRNYYVLGTSMGNTVYNSDVYAKLLKDGLITGKEARTYMNLATIVAKNTEDNATINRAMNEAISQAVTKVSYITRKQRSFVFISGNNSNVLGNEYKIDQEVY